MKNLKVPLLLDFIITGFVALVQLGATDFLSPWLGISTFLLRSTGLFLVVFVAFIAFSLTRSTSNLGFIKAIISLNVLWAIVCLLFVIIKKSELTQLGISFVAIQFIAVLFFALLQFKAFKKVAV